MSTQNMNVIVIPEEGAEKLMRILSGEPGRPTCWMCGAPLTDGNTAEQNDIFGCPWCRDCTDEFDMIEWNKENDAGKNRQSRLAVAGY